MFGLGPTELLLMLAIVMIIFGAGKLPQVFGALGKGVKEFRQAAEPPTPSTQLPQASSSAPAVTSAGTTTAHSAKGSTPVTPAG